MHRTSPGHGSSHSDKRDEVEARPNVRQATRTATAAAALAALGMTGVSAAQADIQPHPPAPARDETRPDGPVRTVMPGDSLWSVATANGLSVEELMAFNELYGDALLTPGFHLRLSPPPAHETPSPTADASSIRQPLWHSTPTGAHRSGPGSHTREHQVVSGDSLWHLAIQHKTTVAQIIETNDMDITTGLLPGQIVKIPDSSAAPLPQEDEQTPEGAATFPGHHPYTRAAIPAHDLEQQRQNRTEISPTDLHDMVRQTAVELGVNPALALAHAEQESGFDHHKLSPTDAVGVMQVTPASGQWAETLVGHDLDLLDPQDNITAGIAIIRANVQRTADQDQAIAAYYQGLYGVQEYGMFEDTRQYVSHVKAKLAGWS